MEAVPVIEILDAIRDVHRRLADRYQELDESAGDERIRLLLDDMERRERDFEQTVVRCEAENPSAVLKALLDPIPAAVRLNDLRERLGKPRTLEELVEETLLLNSTLCDAYLTLARDSPDPRVSELFRSLAALEERNDCHYAQAILEDCR